MALLHRAGVRHGLCRYGLGSDGRFSFLGQHVPVNVGTLPLAGYGAADVAVAATGVGPRSGKVLDIAAEPIVMKGIDTLQAV